MSNTVRPRARQPIPGGGFDSNGNPKQGKTAVWGKIVVTNYSRGGESLTPNDLGLATLDWLDLKVDTAVASASGSETRIAPYAANSNQFYVLSATGTNGQYREIAATEDPTLSFHAVGDSADDVELT